MAQMPTSVFGAQVAGSVALLAVGAYTTFPAFAPFYARRFYQKYNADRTAVEVSDHVLSLTDNVLRDLQFPTEKEKKLDIFISHDLEPQYHGSLAMKRHVLLGVPCTFNWKLDKEFEFNKAQVFKDTFPWEHPDSAKVKEALMLTDAEKEFVIARQIGYLDSKNIYVRLMQRFCCLGAGFFMGHLINYKYGLYKQRIHTPRTTAAVSVVFAVCSAIGGLLMLFIDDSYTCYLDRHADKYAGSISKKYTEAGVSYYNKLLESNKAFRNIVPGMDRVYTAYGNQVTGLFRTKTIPLVARRDYLKKLELKTPADTAQTTAVEAKS